MCVSGKWQVRTINSHLPMEVVLLWISPEADPESRICPQVVYLESQGTLKEGDTGKAKQAIRSVGLSLIPVWVIAPYSPWEDSGK